VLGEEEGLDSFVSHKPALPNLNRIRDAGLEIHLAEQKERRLLVEHLLVNYNEGRSMSFYCRACTLMPPAMIRDAMSDMDAMLAADRVDSSDIKAKAKAMKSSIKTRAEKAAISLRLRKKKR